MAKPNSNSKSSSKSTSNSEKTVAGKKVTTALMSPKDVGQSREAEEALTKSDRLQFLTLIQGGSEAVTKKEPKGVTAGAYVLGKKVLLGDEFDSIVSISRPRAMIFENNKVTVETFDPSSEEWSKCKAARKGGNTGIEFLLWIPSQQAFATFYFKNTAREVGADAARCRDAGMVARFSSRVVDGKENSWFVPVVTQVDPQSLDEPLEMPSEEMQAEAVAAFESYKQETKAEPEPEGKRPR